MIYLAGEPDDIWWNGEVKEVYLGADLVWKSGPTIEVFEVSVTRVTGSNVFHPLINLSPPPGEVWEITVEGHITQADNLAFRQPVFVVGNSRSGAFGVGPVVWSGGITATERQVGVETTAYGSSYAVSFVGTVTVTYPD